MKKGPLVCLVIFSLLMLVVGAVCGGAKPTATPVPTATPTRVAATTATPTPVPTATPVSTPTPTPAPKEFKFGYTGALSGTGAPWGIGCRDAHKLAAEEINAAGGIKVGGQTYLINVIAYDDKYLPAEATVNTNKLVFADKVQYMGCMGGGVCPACQTITEANKVIVWPGAYGKAPLLKGRDYSFRMNPESAMFAYVVLPWIKNNYPDIKTVALMGENVSAVVELLSFDREQSIKLGWKIVSDQLWEGGTKDFYPFASKAIAANPDMILIEASPATEALALKQLYELGYKGLRATLTAIDVYTMATIAPKEALENLVSGMPNWESEGVLPKAANEFYAKWMAKYGPPFIPVNVEQYPVLYALKKAIEQAGTLDTTKVKEVLESPDFTFDTPYGVAKFGNCGGLFETPHQAEYPLYVSQVKDGKLVTLAKVIPDWKELLKK